MEQACRRCGESKAPEEFRAGHKVCKSCQCADQRARYRGDSTYRDRARARSQAAWQKSGGYTDTVAERFRADRAANPRKYRMARIWRYYKLTEPEYEAMRESQGYACRICRRSEADAPEGGRLHIDHDHGCCPGERSCGKCVRGLLCGPCNKAIGAFGDDPELLMAAAEYLLSARNVLTAAEIDQRKAS